MGSTCIEQTNDRHTYRTIDKGMNGHDFFDDQVQAMRRHPDYSVKWWTTALVTIIASWMHSEWGSLVSLMITQWGPNQSPRSCGDRITFPVYQAQCPTPNSISEWLISMWQVWGACSVKRNLPLQPGNNLSCDACHFGWWGLSFNYR